MNQELGYAEMLEIPVNTVNVVKKKSLFKRKPKDKKPEEDIKDQVVENVNDRLGAVAAVEDYSDPPMQDKAEKRAKGEGIVLTCEAIAVCLLAVGIFVTNLIMPNSAINTFITGFGAAPAQAEKSYYEFTLAPVNGDLSTAEVVLTDGAMCMTAKSAVYPVCDGEVTSVTQTEQGYTVEIAHTSRFSSVITGLSTVYSAVGDQVKANVPVAYSNGEGEVRVTLFNGDELLNGYTLNGAVPVWNT